MSVGVKLSSFDSRDHVIDLVIDKLIVTSSTQAGSPRSPELVFNQHQTSMCVASSGTTMKTIQDNEPNLNPYFLYNLRESPYQDAGMSLRDMMTLLYKFGSPTYEAYPVRQVFIANPANKTNRPIMYMGKKTLQSAAQHKIAGYGRIRSLDTLLKCFALNHNPGPYQNTFGAFPIVTGIFNDSMTFYKPTWKQTLSLSALTTPLVGARYHCTSLIESVDMVGKRFRLQNSWDKNWGDQGCTYMSFDDWEKCVVECFYGVKSPELAAVIRQELIQTSQDFQNYQNGDLESDNKKQGDPVDTSFVVQVDDEKDERIFKGTNEEVVLPLLPTEGCPNVALSKIPELHPVHVALGWLHFHLFANRFRT